MLYTILLLFCLYLPFQLAINPAGGVDLASGRIIILILTLCWILAGLKNKKIIIPPKIQTLLIISFLFFSFLSLAVSQNIDWSLRKLAFIFSIFPLYFVIAGTIKNKKEAEKIISFLAWGTGIAALIGIIQFSLQFIFGLDNSLKIWASITPYFLGSSFSQAVLENSSWLVNVSGYDFFRAVSVFPDPHMFSFYLELILPWMLALYFFTSRRKKTYLALFLISLVAFFLTFSRGGYVGLLAGIFFTAILFGRKIIAEHKKKFILSLAVLALIIFIPNPFSQRLVSSFNASEGSNMGRIEMWKRSLEVSLNNPVLGVGLGNYPLAVMPSAGYRDPIYSHNLYLDIASETGIINAIIWITLIATSFISFWHQSKKNLFYSAGAISLIIFSVHSFFETPLFSVSVLPLLLIIISLSTTGNEKNT